MNKSKSKCSRCGAELERSGEVARDRIYHDYDLALKISRGCEKDFFGEGDVSKHMLCGDCWHAIRLWIAGNADAELDRIFGRVGGREDDR